MGTTSAGKLAGALAGWRRFYGQHPLHLLALLGCFTLAGYAISFAAATPTPLALLIWFVGAIIGHDLVLFPLYALADRSLLAGLRRRHPTTAQRPARVAAVNHIRVPVLGAGLLLLVFSPSILRQGDSAYVAASGLTMAPYLGRWLLISAAMFLLSALLYALRLARTTSPTDDTSTGTGTDGGGADPQGADRESATNTSATSSPRSPIPAGSAGSNPDPATSTRASADRATTSPTGTPPS